MNRVLILAVFLMVPAPASAQDLARGEALYQRHCATCHGIDGAGGGPRAAVLSLQPIDLTRLAAGAGGSFPYERAARRIDGREALVAHGSPMPVWGDFFAGRQASLKLPDGQPLMADAPVIDLLAWLATIQR